ncbi:MAG: 2,3-bisphosphoglycerate-independent phosphoglycerate mutase [Bacteroidales bacterium]|nr:2,3-bisphosphoglycerate-independent phosphoglycerate mutase [Bacteroidales bacterium]
MGKDKKVILIIMDGWGIGDGTKSDVIAGANIPFIKSLVKEPHAKLLCSGEDVGLPEGQMGNSEVGHLNIGAGRVVYQDLVKINLAIRDNSISSNKVLINAFKYANENNKAVHFLGLISDGGVHSLSTHLMKLCDIATEWNLKNVFVHCCTDGRDTDPKSGLGYVKELNEHLKKTTAKITSLSGRYYTMDRDKRWERVKQGYDLLVHGKGKQTTDILKAIQESYNEGITDEFIKPIVVTDDDGSPIGTIKKGDVFICFNFRTDRLREITTVLTQKEMPEFDMHTIPLHYLTMTRYDESFKNINIIFDKEDVTNTIGEVISKAGKKQIRIAETEKYPHVTFFLSGGREEPFEGESRILIQSPKVATYDLKPEMSAYEVKDAIVKELKKAEVDFVCLNFANADMVGHTGFYQAIRQALEAVDKCIEEIITTARAKGYSVILTADHGNADFALNPDGSPNTAHSNNPVPIYLLDDNYKKISDGKLCDIAPTILKLMNIDIPKDMTGKILI